MNLGNVSESDMTRMHSINNPPEHVGGFGSESSSNSGDFNIEFEGLEDLFGSDDNDSFGGFGSNTSNQGTFGGNNGGNNTFGGGPTFGGGNNTFGGGNSFGGGTFGGGSSLGSTFGNPGGMQSGMYGQGGMYGQNPPMQESEMDKLVDAAIDASKSLGHIIVEMAKSIKLRTVDDFGYLGTQLIIVGASVAIGAVLGGIVGTITDIKFLKFSGLPFELIFSGALTLGTGLVSIGTSALVLSKRGDTGADINSIPDTDTNNNFTDTFEENIGAESDDLFGDDFDDLFEDFDFDDDTSDTISNAPPEPTVAPVNLDDELPGFVPDPSLLDGIQANQLISRDLLYRTFKPMFTYKTPDFAVKTELDNNSTDFLKIQTLCTKALSNVLGCELEDVHSDIVSIHDSFFSYEIRMERVKKKINTDEFATELNRYFRADSSQTAVSATVAIEADCYKIVVTKGLSAIITFGDVFKQQYCEDFFLNVKKKMPIISGITELGEVILDDAKLFDTMVIAGKPRSGKSWYVLSILASLMLFNSPEDVQFVIVDPKESNLFKTLALMPHVAGIHNDDNILEIMDDLIINEAPRRKKLLADHRVDDIWALRDKGIKLPILYLVIDEYLSVVNKLGDASKELNKKLQTIISQLPSLGIRLIFIPHRVTSIVDKTNRTMLQFSACVRSDQSEIIDTLDIKKWSRPLVNPGDIAVKSAAHPDAIYVRGAALTTSDNQNTDFIRTAARAFYKIGVDLPDRGALTVAYNRDDDYIRSELQDSTTRLQYDASKLLEDI